MITCGSLDGGCTPPSICGGGGVPSQCGDNPVGGGACDAGLKCDLDGCDGGTLATLSGQIFDPAGNDPLYNVVVYVPNGVPDKLVHGQFAGDGGAGTSSCESCSSLYTGDPIVSTTTDTDGNFTLTGVPVPQTGPNAGQVPIVIQVGKWRRQMLWTGVTACATNPPASGTVASLLRLPGAESPLGTGQPATATDTLDDLPQIAVSTGSADTMECLFQRIGFAAGEYVCGWNAGTGHIHVFQGGTSGDGQGGNGVSGCSQRSSSSLWNSTTNLNNYDILVLSCEGEEAYKASPANLETFTNLGGRAFASHFHYSWFTGSPMDGNGNPAYTAPADWGSNLATWYPYSNDLCPNGTSASSCENTNSAAWENAVIVEQLSDGGTPFKTWLGNVNALDTVAPGGSGTGKTGELNIQQCRMNAAVTSSNVASQNWIIPDDAGYVYNGSDTNNHALPANVTQYFSFNTPVDLDGGVPQNCGRVVYSDLHVGAAANDYSSSTTVPGGCTSSTLTPQEKALEYMLLDLASCVGSDTNLPTPTPVCTEATCPPDSCGVYPNGCGDGGTINCGTCEGGAECVHGLCATCTPLAHCPVGVTCGDWPDGCGGSISCGPCTIGTCIGGTCVSGCTPEPCPVSVTCGQTSNGCGGLTPVCGTCTGSTSCGAGGVPGVCGEADSGACIPQGCPSSIECGLTGDGCGGTVDCGSCTPPASCGGGGTPGVCGAPSCTPATCSSLGANCGQVADGCGGLTADCGMCTGSATCGGGGTANVCGVPACTPSTCASLGLNCGQAGDGCTGVLNCGTCTPPDTCGGGGVANVCGTGGPR
jgi:hypothetical protein